MNPKQDTHKENHTKAHHNQIIENKYQRKKILKAEWKKDILNSEE